MQKTNSNHTAATAHRRTQVSTTLNRRYVRRPVKKTGMVTANGARTMSEKSNGMSSAKSGNVAISIKRSPKITRFGSPAMRQVHSMQQAKQMQQVKKTSIKISSTDTEQKQQMISQTKSGQMKQMGQMRQMKQAQTQQAEQMQQMQQEKMMPVQSHPMQATANARIRERQARTSTTNMQATRATAKELKDQAIKKALMSAATANMSEQKVVKSKKSTKSVGKMRFGFGRVMLALSCATAVVFAIAYLVNLNMPDISLRVAAMQTGIDASYPGYVPRDYSISSITSENGKVSLEFRNSVENKNFTLAEEASSWDSNALMTNYVKEEFGDNYSIIREQGLTIYVNESNAAWVNGGIVYKLTAEPDVLSNKQIRSIAVSL